MIVFFMKKDEIYSKLIGNSIPTYYKWRQEHSKDINKRLILKLLNDYFSDDELEEFTSSKKIRRLEEINELTKLKNNSIKVINKILYDLPACASSFIIRLLKEEEKQYFSLLNDFNKFKEVYNGYSNKHSNEGFTYLIKEEDIDKLDLNEPIDFESYLIKKIGQVELYPKTSNHYLCSFKAQQAMMDLLSKHLIPLTISHIKEFNIEVVIEFSKEELYKDLERAKTFNDLCKAILLNKDFTDKEEALLIKDAVKSYIEIFEAIEKALSKTKNIKEINIEDKFQFMLNFKKLFDKLNKIRAFIDNTQKKI